MIETILKRAAVAGVTLALAACGGGVGGSSSVELLNINGVAAAGQALVQAQVELRCAAGTPAGPVSSDGSGIFRILLDGAKAPCMVGAAGGAVAGVANTLPLHGYAAQAGIANATVLSELVLARALGMPPATAFAAFGSGSTGPSDAAIAQATAYVGDQFAALGLPRPSGDLLNGLFSVGDANDQLIDNLSTLLAVNGSDVSSLVAASAAAQPWTEVVTQRPCDAGTLQWAEGASACSAGAGGAADGASVTLTNELGANVGQASFSCSNGSWGAATNAVCRPPPSPCAAQTAGWSVSGSSCSAALAATASGQSLTVTDAVAPSTGSATFACSNGSWSEPGAASCATAQPRGCAAQAVSWSVSGNSCDGNLAGSASGASAIAVDGVLPATGSATYACSDGSWSGSSAVSCSVPAQSACSAQTLNWSDGSAACGAAAPTTASGASVVLADTTGPATGSATFACSNGSWGHAGAASCSLPAACGAQTLDWSVNGNSCSAAVPATASGSNAVAADSVGPATGSASFACSNGNWGSASAATCSQPAACAAQVLSWSVGGSGCSAPVASTASGGSAIAGDATLPTIGNASFSCSNGNWGSASNASCTTPPQGPQSLALNLQADNGGRWYDFYSDVFGEIGKAWNGSATLDGFFLTSRLPDYVTVGTGQDIFPHGGTWTGVGSIGYNLDGYTGVGSFSTPITSVALNLAPFVAEKASVLSRPYATAISAINGQVTLRDGVVTGITLASTVTFSWLSTPFGDLFIAGNFSIDGNGRFTLSAGMDTRTYAGWDFSGVNPLGP